MRDTKGGESATVYKLVSRKLAGLSAPVFCSNDCTTCVGGKESVSVQESCDPWWETSNEAVVGCMLNTHMLVLRRRRRRRNRNKKCNFRPLGRLQSSAFVLSLPHPPSTSSWEVLSCSFCPCQARSFLRDEGTSFICLDEQASAADVPPLPSHPPLGSF